MRLIWCIEKTYYAADIIYLCPDRLPNRLTDKGMVNVAFVPKICYTCVRRMCAVVKTVRESR